MMRIYSFLLLITILFSCSNNEEKKHSISAKGKVIVNAYAKGFSIKEYENGLEFEIFHPQTGKKIDHFTINRKIEGVKLIPQCPKKCIPFSATHISFLDKLNELNTIKGVTYGSSIFNKSIQDKLKSNTISDLGSDAKPNKELILSIQPDIIYSLPQTNQIEWLKKFNNPTVYVTEFLENHPLAQAEWIRFFGYVYGKDEIADSIFNNIKTQYEHIKTKTKFGTPVLVGELWSEKWALPGGKSITSQYIKDAGGMYLSFNDSSSGSRQIDFELVLQNQHKAKYWLMLTYANEKVTKEYLIQKNKKYQFIELIHSNNTSVCNTAKTPYFEKGILEPHIILKELKALFRNNYVDQFYYKKIKKGT